MTTNVTQTLFLPGYIIPGPYRLLAVIDAKGEIAETNEANNFPCTPATGAPYKIV